MGQLLVGMLNETARPAMPVRVVKRCFEDK
jgi:hypothetical protein